MEEFSSGLVLRFEFGGCIMPPWLFKVFISGPLKAVLLGNKGSGVRF